MENSPSKTALLVSAYRARATDRGLCHDPWAAALAGDEGQAYARRYDLAFPHMELWMATRTAFLDAHVRWFTERAPQPVTQVVVLGAGLDTRAARLACRGVRFFEVDHPLTQADKLARLDKIGDYPRDAAIYVQCDFEHDDFLTRLARVGFDAAAPALILWEGVTYYLDEASVRATVRTIARDCHEKTTIVFDYASRKLVAGEVRETDRGPTQAVSELGEPMRFGSDHLLPLLYEEGFRHVRTVSFEEACLTFTGTYARERKFRFQNLARASRVPCAELI